MKKQRILSLLLALVMTFSLLPGTAMAAKTEDFTDVSKSDWYYKYVDFVTDRGYFAGTSEDTFSPEMAMTRGMFVVVLAAMEGVKVDNNVAPFDDVPAGTWYSGAVKWAAENGVVAGVGNNKFAPDTAISREQMAVIMNAYVNWHIKQHSVLHTEEAKIENFTDKGSISSWAASAVENCRKWGLLAGDPDGNFLPQYTATRAEVSTVIYNLAWMVMGGGGGGGGTPSTDYIYNAINAALADIQGDLASNGFNTDANKGSMDVTLKGSSIVVTMPTDSNGNLFASAATDSNNARPQTVTATATVADDTLKSIALVALKQAYALVGSSDLSATVASNATNDLNSIKAIVKPYMDKFTQITGVAYTPDDLEQMAKETYSYAKAYASSVWANFRDAEGKYYTGNVTITPANGTPVTILVDTSARIQGSKRDAVINMAEGIARGLYASLTTNSKYANWTDLNSVNLTTTVEVAFSGNTAAGNTYKADTDLYPYVYPINIALNFTANDLTGLLQYRFQNGSELKLIVSDAAQTKYNQVATKLIDKLISDFVQNSSWASSLDTVAIKNKVSTSGTFASMKDFLDTLYTENGSSANAATYLDTQIGAWLSSSNMDTIINYVVSDCTGASGTDNQAILDIVDEIADEFALAFPQLLSNKSGFAIGSAMLDAMIVSANPSDLNDVLTHFSMVPAGIPNELMTYILVEVCNQLNGYTPTAFEAGQIAAMPTKVAELIDGAVADATATVRASHAADLAKVNNLKAIFTDFDALAARATMTNLIKAIQKPEIGNQLDDIVTELGTTSVINQVTSLIAQLPAGAKVSLAGVEVDKTVLENALVSGNTCTTLINTLSQNTALTLADFYEASNGEDLVVTVGGRTFTLGLYIEIK